MVSFRVMVPVASPAEADGTVSLLQQRVWYAQRAARIWTTSNLLSGRKAFAEHVGAIATGLGLGSDAAASMLAAARMLPYAEGEIIQPFNSIPEVMSFITEGRRDVRHNARWREDIAGRTRVGGITSAAPR